MRKALSLTLICATALGFATAASAALDTAWIVKLWVTDLNKQNGGSTNLHGCGSSAQHSPQSPSTTSVYLYVTGSEPNYYFIDRRLSQPAPVAMVWDLTVAAGPGYASSSFELAVWNETGTFYDLDDNWATDPDNAFMVSLYQGSTLLYTFDPAVNGTSTTPQFTAEYPISAGGKIESFFTLKREPLIPEPGSIVGLGAGLTAAVGMALRRRRAVDEAGAASLRHAPQKL